MANSQPEKKFKAGAIQVTIWNNPSNKGEGSYRTVTLDRSYKDENGNWQHTSGLREMDVPRAILVLQKAYEYIEMEAKKEPAQPVAQPQQPQPKGYNFKPMPTPEVEEMVY